jgi:SPP1 gp7 family putative phage head morphogenesis protein
VKKDLAQVEQEVLMARIKAERAILKEIEEQYERALTEINLHLARLLGRQDANLPHVIHRVEYQRVLKQQVQAALDKLHSGEYESVMAYLNESYTDAFVGTVYTLHHQDMPVILPIDQNLAVKAITLDTKLKKTLYEEMGVDIKKLKRIIPKIITRGISSGMMYSEIARNISNQAGIPMRRAKTIARTEAGRVQEQASYDAALQATEKGARLVKQWNAIRDGKTRDAHRALHNQTRELDEPFEIDGREAMYPHDFGDPALDCNCRCTMLTVAKASLDADTLKQMEADAAYFKLDKTKDIEDFKKNYAQIAIQCERVTELEHAADDVFVEYIGYIFATESDPIELMKYKNIAETFEACTDAAKDVSDSVRKIIMRYTE